MISRLKKFHQYLYGQRFKTLQTISGFLGLFQADNTVPTVASPRIQRWALLLATCDYELIYREGHNHGNTGGLSRLPVPDAIPKVAIPGETVLLMDRLEAIPVGADHISDWKAYDPLLQKVQTKVPHGWGNNCPGKRFAALLCEKRQTELTKWVHIVGKLCGRTSERSTTAAGELAYYSSRNCENLESCA